MLNIIAGVDFLREVNLGRTSLQEVIKRLKEEDNYQSNAIEGSTVSITDTLAILNGTLRDSHNYRVGEINDVKGYDSALDYIITSLGQDQPLTVSFIQEIHYRLMYLNLGLDAGNYRNYDVGTVTGVTYSTHATVSEEVKTMVDRFYRFEGKEHPIARILDFKSDFIATHPFADGNGRTSRLLMNYLLIQEDYLPVVVKVNDRDKYIKAMEQGRLTGRVELLTTLICGYLVDSYEELKKGNLKL